MAGSAGRAIRKWVKRQRWLYRLISPINGIHHNWAMLWPRLRHGIDQNRVVFSSYQMRAYSDNPRYISEALHELRPNTDIVWLLRDADTARERFDIPDYVRLVEFPTKASSEEAGRAKVLVDNWRKRNFIRLGKKQVYLFSPHYDRGFKRAARTDPNFLYGNIVEKRCSIAVIGSDVHAPVFRAMYGYEGEFMMVGLPRNDLLISGDPALASRVRERLGVRDGDKLLIYAPTYRDRDRKSHSKQAIELDLPRTLQVLEETTGAPWRCLIRAHYFIKGFEAGAQDEHLIDVTNYPEMAELLLVSDAMITDYSSCAGDFALTGRPIWLYQADIEEYRSLDRDLLIDPAETPYMRAESMEQLEALIRSTTPESARENCKAVLDYYGTHETGHAARSAAEYIIQALENH